MPELTKSQIDRLGRRLATDADDSDRQAFFDFREQFRTALSGVENELRHLLRETVVVGRIKTLDSVIAKLQREHTRLSTMQDIAGCRIVLSDIDEQNAALGKIKAGFSASHVTDLRESAHSGYRAVHIIATASNRLPVEIQLRTEIQDQWAQASEKLADRYGIEVKYGSGPKHVTDVLIAMSDLGRLLDQGSVGIPKAVRNIHELKEMSPKNFDDLTPTEERELLQFYALKREEVLLKLAELQIQFRMWLFDLSRESES